MQTDTQTPPILPQSPNGMIPEPAPAAAPGATVSPDTAARKRVVLIIAVIVIGVLGVMGVLMGGRAPGARVDEQAVPTPTATQSAESTRPLSAIATQSAFLEFETAADELTRGIQNAPIQNQELLPPRLDLPLGF